jgi:hypothetical protein
VTQNGAGEMENDVKDVDENVGSRVSNDGKKLWLQRK